MYINTYINVIFPMVTLPYPQEPVFNKLASGLCQEVFTNFSGPILLTKKISKKKNPYIIIIFKMVSPIVAPPYPWEL
jgi:hypothetical protein